MLFLVQLKWSVVEDWREREREREIESEGEEGDSPDVTWGLISHDKVCHLQCLSISEGTKHK